MAELAGYLAWSGRWRPWRYTDEEREALDLWHPEWDGEARSRCYDCGLPYGQGAFGDLVVPDEVWERINPTHHEAAGLLCPNCIFERLSVIDHPGDFIAMVYPVVLKKSE